MLAIFIYETAIINMQSCKWPGRAIDQERWGSMLLFVPQEMAEYVV